MSKKTVIVLISILSIVVIALAVTGITYAVWSDTPDAELDTDIPVDETNPSEKHLIFRALDSAGNFTDGAPVSYAVIGFDGLVSEIKIPATHNNLAVTKICLPPPSSPDFGKRFAGSIMTSLVIPESVTSIENEACANSLLLAKVTILGDGEINIGSLAFANCPSLSAFETSRSIHSDGTYLVGCPAA